MGLSFKPLQWLTNTGPGNLVILISLLLIFIAGPAWFSLTHLNGSWWALTQVLPPLAAVCVMMGMRYGSPLNWWSPYFGTMMTVNFDKLSDRERAGEYPEAIQNEIAQWVANCSKGRYIKINPYRYQFLRKGDAMMFKLAWG